jgi:hypothetical protein
LLLVASYPVAFFPQRLTVDDLTVTRPMKFARRILLGISVKRKRRNDTSQTN